MSALAPSVQACDHILLQSVKLFILLIIDNSYIISQTKQDKLMPKHSTCTKLLNNRSRTILETFLCLEKTDDSPTQLKSPPYLKGFRDQVRNTCVPDKCTDGGLTISLLQQIQFSIFFSKEKHHS